MTESKMKLLNSLVGTVGDNWNATNDKLIKKSTVGTNISVANKGRKISDETRAKMSTAAKNRKISDETRIKRSKPVIIDGVGYKSIPEASSVLNMHPRTVKYRIESCNFPTWKYKE